MLSAVSKLSKLPQVHRALFFSFRSFSDVPRNPDVATALESWRYIQYGKPVNAEELKKRHQPGALIRGTNFDELVSIQKTGRIGYDPNEHVPGKHHEACMARHICDNTCRNMLSTTLKYPLGFEYASTSNRFIPGQGVILQFGRGGLVVANQATHWKLHPDIYYKHDKETLANASQEEAPVNYLSSAFAREACELTEIDVLTSIGDGTQDLRPSISSLVKIDYLHFVPEMWRFLLGDGSRLFKTQPVFEPRAWHNPDFAQVTWSFEIIVPGPGHNEEQLPGRYVAMNKAAIAKGYIRSDERLLTQADALALHIAFTKAFPETTAVLQGVVKTYYKAPIDTAIGSDQMVLALLKNHESYLRSCSLFNQPTMSEVVKEEAPQQAPRLRA